jgi:hypothetical protein
MGEYSDFGQSSNAARGTGRELATSPWPANRGFIEGTVERKFLMPDETIVAYGVPTGPTGSTLNTQCFSACDTFTKFTYLCPKDAAIRVPRRGIDTPPCRRQISGVNSQRAVAQILLLVR